jgi:hypothetical protein
MIWAKSLTISATPTGSMLISGGLVGQEKWMAMDTSGIACCETNVEVGIEIRLIDKTAENDALLRSEPLPLHRSINTLSCCKGIEDEKILRRNESARGAKIHLKGGCDLEPFAESLFNRPK